MPHVYTTPINVGWSINERVYSSTRQLSWNVKKRVYTSAIQIKWNVQLRVYDNLVISWNVSDDPITITPDMTQTGCLTYPTPQNPFKRLFIDHIIKGNTKIYWEMSPRFTDAQPWTFQLQYSQAGTPNSDDWVNVGNPVVNNFYAADTIQRLFGKILLSYYRLQLTTPVATYYSQPTNVFGKLNKRDWLLAREVTRKELLRLNKYTATEGFLLIAKRSGTLCPNNDPVTNEPINPNCPICYGTGYSGGYYPPFSCTFFDLALQRQKEMIDLQARGTIGDVVREGRFVGYPQLHTRDVFVDKESDERYYLAGVGEKALMRDVPIVVSPILMLAPYTDVIYTFPVLR